MITRKFTLRTLAVLQAFACLTSLQAIICSSPYHSYNSYQGCCYTGPSCECSAEEHVLVTTTQKYLTYDDACNPDNNISDSDFSTEDYIISVNPFETVCGINSNSNSIRYFSTTGPENCEQCGFEQRQTFQNQGCGG